MFACFTALEREPKPYTCWQSTLWMTYSSTLLFALLSSTQSLIKVAIRVWVMGYLQEHVQLNCQWLHHLRKCLFPGPLPLQP